MREQRRRVYGLLVVTIVATLVAGCSRRNSDMPPQLQAVFDAAEGGDAEAQFTLGNMYYTGPVLEQNYQEAARWTRMAADQGHAEAAYNYGLLLEKGEGVERSYNDALNWWRQAATQGSVNAQFRLGTIFSTDSGVQPDYVEAVKWLTMAAEQNHEQSELLLGQLYYAGTGVEQSYSDAVMFYSKAAEKGNATAQFELGSMMLEGLGMDEADRIQGYVWLKLASERVEGDETDRYRAAADKAMMALSPPELEEAQRRVESWIASYLMKMRKAQQQPEQQPQ